MSTTPARHDDGIDQRPWWRAPYLARLIRRPMLCRMLVGMAVGYVLLASTGLGFIKCPSRYLLNLPCPSCGLTRSMMLALNLKWVAAFRMHMFGPPLLCFGMAGCVVSVLPSALRRKLANLIESVEVRCACMPLLVLALLMYWVVRCLQGALP